jgi:nitrate reductase NapAB chaperone NapD
MRATLIVRSREETIATVTTNILNIRQYYTIDPKTDGILVLVQDEGDTTREI